MANIGSFEVGTEFQGEIVTPESEGQGRPIVAETSSLNDNAPATASMWAGRRSAQPGRNVPGRPRLPLARSTILPSTRRSTRTCSTTRAVKATPALVAAAQEPAGRPLHQPRPVCRAGLPILPGVGEREPVPDRAGRLNHRPAPRVLFLGACGRASEQVGGSTQAASEPIGNVDTRRINASLGC